MKERPVLLDICESTSKKLIVKRFGQSGEGLPKEESSRPKKHNFKRSAELKLTELSADEVATPEDEWVEPGGRKQSSKIILFLGLGLLVMVSVGVWIFAQDSFSSSTREPEVNSEVQAGEMGELPEMALSSYLESASGAEVSQSIKETVRGYMESTTAEERCDHILGDEILLPEVLKYEARTEIRSPRGLKKISRILPNSMASIPYWSVWAHDLDDAFFEFIVVPGETKMVIDWACSVG